MAEISQKNKVTTCSKGQPKTKGHVENYVHYRIALTWLISTRVIIWEIVYIVRKEAMCVYYQYRKGCLLMATC